MLYGESEDVMRMAEKLGVKYRGYDEKDLCMAMNMLYSDYCEALRNFIPKDQEPMLYIHLAKAILEDEDAPDSKIWDIWNCSRRIVTHCWYVG